MRGFDDTRQRRPVRLEIAAASNSTAAERSSRSSVGGPRSCAMRRTAPVVISTTPISDCRRSTRWSGSPASTSRADVWTSSYFSAVSSCPSSSCSWRATAARSSSRASATRAARPRNCAWLTPAGIRANERYSACGALSSARRTTADGSGDLVPPQQLLCLAFRNIAGRLRIGPPELRAVDVDVRLVAGHRPVVALADPPVAVLERHLDAGDVSIVAVIDLRRNAPDHRLRVADIALQQSRLLVEVQRADHARRQAALNDVDISAVDRLAEAHAPVVEEAANLPRERHGRTRPWRS